MSGRIVDLSVEVNTDTKGPPSTDLRVELTRYNRGPGFWQVTAVAQSLHTGSHIDAPLHCFEDGATTADIPLDRVIGEAVIVDCTPVSTGEPVDAGLLERRGGDVGPGDIVLLATGWSDYAWGRFPEYFIDSPYLTEEAARWLAERRPAAVGFDFFEEYCARLPDFTSEDFVCHRILLGAGIPLLEQLTNLAAVGRARFEFSAPFYRIEGCDGAPARFFARLP
ncbi:MAG: cyclase family protein [Acidimicrobiia bacterium]